MHPLKTFIVYSSKDKTFREELERHLQILIDSQLIELWSDKQILPGEVWDAVIKQQLEKAELILLLVSVDFYSSDYIRNEEFKIALQRLKDGKAMIIPIIVRPCLWNRIPIIKDLQVLPHGGMAVSDEDVWKIRDKAWQQVVEKLAELIESRPPKPSQARKNTIPPTPPDQPSFSLIPNPTMEKLSAPHGIYSFFLPSDKGNALYLMKLRERRDHSDYYDLFYLNLKNFESKHLADLGNDNYTLFEHEGHFYTTSTVERYTTHQVIAFNGTEKVTTPYTGLVVKWIFIMNGQILYKKGEEIYFNNPLGRTQVVTFLRDCTVPFAHPHRNLLLAGRKNTKIASKYPSEWNHPNCIELFEVDQGLNILRQQVILEESNDTKFANFMPWGENKVIFMKLTDENGDGMVDYTDTCNKTIMQLDLDTLEIKPLYPIKSDLIALYGLPDGRIFFVDMTQEDVLYTGYIYDPATKKTIKHFELKNGHFVHFRLQEDYSTLFFKRVLPNQNRDTFYDWENESEFYRMPFARYAPPSI